MSRLIKDTIIMLILLILLNQWISAESDSQTRRQYNSWLSVKN